MSDSDSSLSAYETFSRKKNSEAAGTKGPTSSVGVPAAVAGRKRPLINLDDSSDEDSLLNFTKHRFTPNKPSKSKSKSSKNDNDTSINNMDVLDSDSDDSVLKNMLIGKSLRSAKKSLKNTKDDNSDSDNDDLDGDKANSNSTRNSTRTKPLGTSVISAAASNAKLNMNIHMDSDDSDDYDAGPKIQIKESEAMKMARLAREALLHANVPIDLHADDHDDDDGLDVGMEYVPKYKRKPQPLSFSSTRQWRSDADNFAANAADFAANIANIAATFTAAESTVATGPMIRLQFRSNIKTAPHNHGGKSLHSKSITLPFRTGTKIEQVMQSYRQRVNPQITSLAQVKFILDGLTMDLQKSLQTYDLEDEDMIDVSISIPPNAPPSEKVTTVPAATAASTATITTNRAMTMTVTNSTPASMAEYVKIKTRIKNGDPSKTHIFQLKSHDSFSKLLKAYRAMHNYSSFKRILLEYNGSTVGEDKTPTDVLAMSMSASMAMSLTSKNEIEMEICDEQERVKQISKMPQGSRNGGNNVAGGSSSNALGMGPNGAGAGTGNSSTINGSAGGIILKIRVNGNDKQCEQYSILPKEHFQKMMDWFCTKHGVLQKDCQFIFDGCPLNPKGDAEEEDLEGGEVIDVKVDQNLLEKGKGKSNGVPASSASASTASSSAGVGDQSSSTNTNTNTSAAKIHKVALSGKLGVHITFVDNRIRVRDVLHAHRKGVFFPGDLIKSLNGKEMIGIIPTKFAKFMKKGKNEVNEMEIVRMGMSGMLEKTAASAPAPAPAPAPALAPAPAPATSTSMATTRTRRVRSATSALPSLATSINSALSYTASTLAPTPTPASTERRVISVHVVRNNVSLQTVFHIVVLEVLSQVWNLITTHSMFSCFS